MRSFILVLLALFLVASQSAEQSVRRRLNEGAVNKRGARGVNPKYTGLADGIEVDVKNRVQRRHLMEDKGTGKEKETDAPEEAKGGDDMSMSMMSM